MKAVVIKEFGGELEINSVADPSPAEDGVVVKVLSTGICRSDWHAWQGHDPDIKNLPHVPGHELAGEIVELGSAVTRWRIGDRVTVPFAAGCGSCPSCDLGDTHVCDHQYQPGFTGWGSFAEFVALRYADLNLIAVPESISSDTAASIGCRFSTAYRAVLQQARCKRDDWLVVFGCGGVGLSAVMIAKAFGIHTIAVDIRDETLALAKKYGAEMVLNSKTVEKIPEAVHELTKGGAHATIDAIGNGKVIMDAIMSLRKRGRHVQVGLMTGRDIITRVPIARVIAWELELLGSHGLHVGGFEELLQCVSRGMFDPGALVTRRVGLQGAIEALPAMSSFQDVGVTMINP